jgi:hypothetical protein
MPTITVSRGTLAALGVSSNDLKYHLNTEQKLLLEALRPASREKRRTADPPLSF